MRQGQGASQRRIRSAGQPTGKAILNHLRFLHYLDEVARVGSIRQAAERLHVAPSAVNRRIQDLEAELGAPLFERLPRGMRLTAAGELFVHYIRSRSAHLEQVRSEIEDLQGLRRGCVRIVVSQAAAAAFLPERIAGFKKKHPLVEFQVQVGDHCRALDSLRTFESDLALIFHLTPETDIRRLDELSQPLCLVMHRDHPLAAQQGPVKLKQCLDYPLVLPARDIAGRQLLDAFLAQRSIKLRPTIESNSFEFLLGYLRYEQALTFQIEIGVARVESELVSRQIDDRGFPSANLVLASLQNRQLPVVAYAFAEYLRTTFASFPGHYS